MTSQKSVSIGILREGKKPFDKRTAFSPAQIKLILAKHPNWLIFVQPSPFRCFSDAEYSNVGAILQEDLSNCNFLFGIKEVPANLLLPGKNYFFFSHTIKLQPHNQPMFQKLIELKSTLYDYETIINEHGERLVAFGRFAGIVGAYNALRMIAQTRLDKTLPAASDTSGLDEIYPLIANIKWPALKIVITGAGRVSQGIVHVLEKAGFKEVSPDQFLVNEFEESVFTMLRSRHYHQHKDGKTWDSSHFYSHPEQYVSIFDLYARRAEVLIAGAYWNPKAPRLFNFDQVRNQEFKINIISDVTCDMDGSIPTTLRASSIDSPFYDVDKFGLEHTPFSNSDHIHVCAVDNLPTELPADASEAFGKQLIEHVLPELENPGPLLERTAILKQGELTTRFGYMRAYGFNKPALA